MLTALVDYDSGNLHSAEKAFQRMAREFDAGTVCVTRDADVVARADRIVLPGDGAFAACRAALSGLDGMVQALDDAVQTRAVPFLGICVGMQLLATRGLEHGRTPGLDWIAGTVAPIALHPGRKIPHMGWNDLVLDRAHPVLAGLDTGDHAYFVHSYQFGVDDPADRLAHCDYHGPITAIVAKGNVIGTQFHPEKSQAAGLRLIANFLTWKP